MPFRPPVTGSFGAPLTPAVIKVTTVQQDANVADPGSAAEDIIASAAGAIAQFVAGQRLNYAAGVVQVQNGRASFDGLDVFYQNQFGHETLHYVAYPSSSPVSVEPEIPDLPEVEPGDLIAVLFLDGAT